MARRRSLQFQPLESLVCEGGDVRSAGQNWARKAGLVLGMWSTPRLLPTGETVTSARCYQCDSCYAGALGARAYKFIGVPEGQLLHLQVEACGECFGTARVARQAKKQVDSEITVAERRSVLDAAENLLTRCFRVTPVAVKALLTRQKIDIPTSKIRGILKQMRRAHGFTTKEFQDFRPLSEFQLGICQFFFNHPLLQVGTFLGPVLYSTAAFELT